MQLQEVVLAGITNDDIQKMFEKVVSESYPNKPTLMYLDVAYLYTFSPSDMPYIQRFTDRMKTTQYRNRNPLQIEWHRMLEKWHNGEYVLFSTKKIKPLQIERTIDRVTNELMENIANGLAGNGDFFNPMIWHAIGNGAEAGSDPLPSDTALSNEIDRIDVTQDAGGGGVSVDGSTFMCIGNHSISVATADFTETGIFDGPKPTGGDEGEVVVDDRMGDHSIFPQEVSHDQNETAVGSSTIVYMCSA